MNNAPDLSRWREAPRGVAYRQWTIVSTGLRLLFRTRFFQVLLAVAWVGAVLMAAAGFVFSQSLSGGGWLETLAKHTGPRFEAMYSVLTGLVALFPDIVVHGIFTLIFYIHSYLGLWLSLLALSVLVPQLITRDRSSNALIVYLSRPLTTIDYLLGKLGIIVGVLLLVWTGPLLCGWLLSMLFSTDRDFIFYSFTALMRALLFNGIAIVTLASLALGVSSLGRQSRTTVIVWIGLWIVMGAISGPPGTPDWVKRTSFTYDLNEARQTVFRFDTALSDAANKLPLIDQRLIDNLNNASQRAEATDAKGAFVFLGAFIALSSFVFLKKLRPE